MDHNFSSIHSLTFRGSTGNTVINDGGPFPLPASGSVGPARMPAAQYAFIRRNMFLTTLDAGRAQFSLTRRSFATLRWALTASVCCNCAAKFST
jgi:hypothetical protein